MKKLIHISIQEISQECETSEEAIMSFIKKGWIIPAGPDDLYFDYEDLARITLIQELQETFEVNDESMQIILNLIDQLNYLKAAFHRDQNFH